MPFGVAVLLLLLGLQVSYTAFAWGAMPIAGWRTEAKGFFGLVWLGVFGVVLLPAYLHAIESSLTCLRSPEPAAAGPARRLLAALGVTILLVALTLAARVAVTAWFPVPMHPPFQRWTGGVGPGLIATVLLLALEVAVLRGIKHQTRRDQKPYPLLIPAAFGALLLGWALWVVWSAFARGRFPVIPWQTEHRSWFGLLWLVATLTVLMPAYVYAMSLGVLGLVRRFYSQDVTQQNLWLVAITTTAMLFVLTLAARVAVTAWFPGPIHPPFEFLNGNLLMGLGASLILALLSALYYRVARAF
ncbi:MAG: hypothetical protein RMK20_10320 [Verrucomicrobiales bacterium]|nr:hypothetical protein [Verrucomicrobiales bacterium]